MKRLLRVAVILINALALIVWGGFVVFWYMVITSDIPPSPTVEELLALNKFVVCWLLILSVNIVFIVFTTDKSTPS
jgi:hypothetical protein